MLQAKLLYRMQIASSRGSLQAITMTTSKLLIQ